MSSADDASGTIHREGETTIITLSLPDWVIALRPLVQLVQYPRAWIVAVILGIPLSEALFRLNVLNQSPVELIVEEYLFRQLILPAGVGLFNLMLSIVSGIIGFFEVLASIPIRLVSPLIGAAYAFGLAVFSAIQTINQSFAAGLESFGIAAPVVVPALFVAEVIALVYLGWLLVQTVDLFTLGIIDDVIDIGQAATWPLRRIVGWFR